MISCQVTGRALTMFVTVFVAWLATCAAARGVNTIVHLSPNPEVNARTQLDLEIMDSFGTAVPWGDLHVHHGRKIHVYVVHEVCLARALSLYGT